MVNNKKCIYGSLTCFVLFCLILLAIVLHLRHENIEKEKRVRTRNGLLEMGLAIQSLGAELNEQMPQDFNEIIKQIDSVDLFQLKSLYDSTVGTGVFRDAWGNPVRLEITNKNKYILISAGPNKKYEKGLGDDIIYEFYISTY